MIDTTKTYRTRDGRDVRIYATDGAGAHSVHGAYKSDKGWHLNDWTSDGCHHPNGRSSVADLIEVKPRHTVDVYIHCNTLSGYQFTSDKDQSLEGGRLIAKIPVEFEEGEGLD